MSSRVLLIKPNISVRKGFDSPSKKIPPIGLAYLAGSLIEAGHEVKIIDTVAISNEKRPFMGTHICFGLTDEEIIKEIKDFSPDLVGVGGFTIQHARIREIVSSIKSYNPALKVVVGGVHATAMPEYVMKKTETDYVIQGHAEFSLIALVDALKSGEQSAIEEVDGICYRDGDKIIITPKKIFHSDLDAIPLPARQLLDHEKYKNDDVSMPVLTSRSCPLRCTFCSIHIAAGLKWLDRDPIKVVDEIEGLVKDWGYKTVSIFDDAANVRPKRLIKICQEVVDRKLDVRLTFPGSLIIQYLTEELLSWMKRAGAISLALPLEHPNEHMRNSIIKKGLSLEKAHQAMQWCREVELLSVVTLIIGMPEETEETLKEMVEYVKNNAKRFDLLSVFIATPFPGTAFYDKCIEEGYLVNPEKNEFLDFDTYTAHISTPTMSREMAREYKEKVEKAFMENRVLDFPLETIRKAMRRPDEETLSLIREEYFRKAKELL